MSKEQALLRKSKAPRKLPEKWTFLSLAFYNAPSLHTVGFCDSGRISWISNFSLDLPWISSGPARKRSRKLPQPSRAFCEIPCPSLFWRVKCKENRRPPPKKKQESFIPTESPNSLEKKGKHFNKQGKPCKEKGKEIPKDKERKDRATTGERGGLKQGCWSVKKWVSVECEKSVLDTPGTLLRHTQGHCATGTLPRPPLFSGTLLWTLGPEHAERPLKLVGGVAIQGRFYDNSWASVQLCANWGRCKDGWTCKVCLYKSVMY